MNGQTWLRDLGGWLPSGYTFTYASADAPSFTFTVAGVDLTAVYTIGMRIKLTQSTGGTKYFIVTKTSFSTDTTVTIYGGTDYTLNNEAISSPFISREKAPVGMPMDPTKWTETFSSTDATAQNSPSANTWYNLSSATLVIPIGVWRVFYSVMAYPIGPASGTEAIMKTTLSTANNSESDTSMTAASYLQGVTSGANPIYGATLSKERTLGLTAKTSYFLNGLTITASYNSLRYLGSVFPTVIKAICAYL